MLGGAPKLWAAQFTTLFEVRWLNRKRPKTSPAPKDRTRRTKKRLSRWIAWSSRDATGRV